MNPQHPHHVHDQHHQHQRGHEESGHGHGHGHGHDGHEQHDHNHHNPTHNRSDHSLEYRHDGHGYERVRERSVASGEHEARRGHDYEHEPRRPRHDDRQRDRRHPKYDKRDRDEYGDEFEWEPIPEEHELRGGKVKNTEMPRPKPKEGERNLKVYESVTENEASQEIDRMLTSGSGEESEEAPPKAKGCCKCSDKVKARLLCRHDGITISDELLDPNVMAWFYFKIMGLKSFQLLCATCVVLGFQLSWAFDENGIAEQPSAVVKYAITYYWTVFPALGGYILFRIDIRCQKQKVIFTSLVVYSIQTALICYICTIAGLAWKLILVPTATITLCILYLILALVPFLVQNGTPAPKPCAAHAIGTLLVLILSTMCWFLLSGLLAHFHSAVALDYFSKPWPIVMFWHWLPAFTVAETFCMLDVYELRKLFQGKRISLKKKSWMFAAIYV